MTGIIGQEVYIPQWSESAIVVGFDAENLSYHLKLYNDDEEAYMPFWYVEVKH